jgi:hypothetical protein
MKIDINQIITTFIGNGAFGKSFGISPLNAKINEPAGVYYDSSTDQLFFTELSSTFVKKTITIGSPSSIPSSAPSLPSSFPSSVPSSPVASTLVPTFSPSLAPNVNEKVHIEATVIISNVNSNVLNNASATAVIQALHNISASAQTVEVTNTKLFTKKGRMYRTVQAATTYSFQIDFIASYYLSYYSGWNSTYLTQVKWKTIKVAVEDGSFQHVLQYLASVHNATQLMDVTCDTISFSSDSVSSDSFSSTSKDSSITLSGGAIAGIVIGVSIASILVFFFVRNRYLINENKIIPSKEVNYV